MYGYDLLIPTGYGIDGDHVQFDDAFDYYKSLNGVPPKKWTNC
jgi:hypothetical protein